MGKGKVFSQDGIVFIYLHGTVAFQIPNDELSRRLSLAMAITERRGYLLTWFFAAPHDSELIGLTNERAIFDNAPAVSVASASNRPRKTSLRFQRCGELQCDGHVEDSAPANATSPRRGFIGRESASPGASSAASSEQFGLLGGRSAAEFVRRFLRQRSSVAAAARGERCRRQQGKGPVIKPK